MTGTSRGNAYYPRLFRVLRVDDGRQQSRIKAAYRKQAEELWGGLNEWLSAADGRFGLPTAYALSHRYIGLPLSQALVRSADRRQFPLMFHRFGLPPGGEISPADMERLIDSWLQMRPCPVSKSLESLWQRGQARERIASVAAVELRSWDGALADCDPTESRKTGGVQLLCWLRRFPKRRLEISFLANLGTQASPQALTVLTATGEPTVEVLPVAGARLQPVFTSEIDTASLVEGVLRLADTSGSLEVTRFPRRVVPFRYDDLLNAYVECERVQLGEDSMLLVKDDHGLPGSVRGHPRPDRTARLPRGDRVPRPARRLGALRRRSGRGDSRARTGRQRPQRTGSLAVVSARPRGRHQAARWAAEVVQPRPAGDQGHGPERHSPVRHPRLGGRGERRAGPAAHLDERRADARRGHQSPGAARRRL